MFEDIYKAMKWAEQYPQEFTLEDDFKKIYITSTGVKKIKLKPMGKQIIDDFVNSFQEKKKDGKPEIREIFGLPVVI